MLRVLSIILLAAFIAGCQFEQQPIANLPVAHFSYSYNNATLTITVDGSDSSPTVADATLTYQWDFNGEASDSGITSSHTFSTGGTKLIKLVVVENGVRSKAVSARITLTTSDEKPATNTPPVAQFTIQPSGLTVQLDASNSSDADNDNLTYQWNLGNGITRAGKNVSYSYATAGNKTISLTVNDGTVNSQAKTQTVQLTAPATNQKPVASFEITTSNLTVNVDAKNSSDADGDNLRYSWSFNNEQDKTGETASHTFSSAGSKTIYLTVNDGQLDSTTVSKNVTLSEPVSNTKPVASFTLSSDGLTVSVNGAASSDAENSPLSYRWSFNNEANKSGAMTSHTFTSAGEKEISLIVSDGEDDSTEVTKVITIEAPMTDPLTEITPFVKESCLFCHGQAPSRGATISYGQALTPEEVEQGIVDYLTLNPDAVDKVKNKPTLLSLEHVGGKPFEDNPKKDFWIAAVDAIASELAPDDSDTNTGTGTILFTEDYESGTVGENPAGWSVNFQYNFVANPSATQYADYIRVSSDNAYRGSNALYVDGRGLTSAMRYSTKEFTLPNGIERVFVRYYMSSKEYIGNRVTNPDGSEPNHNHFMALEAGQNDEIRIGEVKGALGMNEYGNDDIVPKFEYWWGKIETKRIEANTWVCVETAFLNDGDTPQLRTWIDGELVTEVDEWADFKNGSAPQNWLDNKFKRVALGWANYSTYDNELYFDDLVVSTERINCN